MVVELVDGGGWNNGSTTKPVEDITSGVSGCSFVPPPGVGIMSSGTLWWCEDVEVDGELFTLIVNCNLTLDLADEI